MKRLFPLLALIIGLLVPFSVSAEEVIRNFSVSATLQPPRNLHITENITYDFDTTLRHGLIRIIPTSYTRNGTAYKLHLKHIQVSMDGHSVPWSLSESSGRTLIKIGDPTLTVNGSHTYVIQYNTDRAITFFPDHSELYWNITGNEWEVPIEKAEFKLNQPITNLSTSSTICFTGSFGTEERSCILDEKRNLISLTRLLLPQEGFTAALRFPLSTLTPPSKFEIAQMILIDNRIIAIPIVILMLMLGIWWAKGRDPKLSTIIPLYEPPQQLNPGELAAIRDEGSLPSHGLTALIIDLAKQGYIQIRYGEEKGIFQKKQTFTFIRTAKLDNNLSKTYQLLLQGLFSQGQEVAIQDLQKQDFYKEVTKIQDAIWDRISTLHLFAARPTTVRITYLVIGLIGGWILLTSLSSTPLGTGVAIISGVIIALGGWFMPRRTQKGTALLAEIKGFEWFLRVTEKDRLAFHNAPERTPEQFQELLPYAIALGVEKEWAKQFSNISLTQPDWIDAPRGTAFNTILFVSTLDHLHSQAVSSGYARPSSAGSGGSGFSGGGSGGGFGGGGGGSW